MSKWWHAYGGLAESGDLEGAWRLVVLGPTQYGPDDVTRNGVTPATAQLLADIPYLKSFDHKPSEAEKTALEPAGWDADPDAICASCGMESAHAPWCGVRRAEESS